MALEIFKLVGSIFVDTDKANDSISKTDKKAEGLGSKLASGAKTAAKWGAGIVAAAGAAGTAMIASAKSTAENMDEIDKMSQKLGMSTTAYQEWDYVLSQSGVDIANMATGMKTLSNKLGDAQNGGKKSIEIFEKLGISMDEVQSMSREDAFAAVVKSLQGMEDSTERAALANQLFGKSGQDLTALFNQSAESTEALKNSAHELGLVMSEETVENGAKMNDAFDTIEKAVGSLKNGLMADFMPYLQVALDWIVEHIPEIRETVTGVINSIKPVIEAVIPLVQSVFGALSNLWEGGLKQTLMGIINFLSGVFTGNWRKAWEGFKSIFSGIVNSLVTIFKSPINFIIRGINTFIGGLNKIKIPDWVPGVGGKGLNIGYIPELAKGGVLEKGQTGFLEGTGAEAVVPLENNSKWISAVAKDMGSAFGGGRVEELLEKILSRLDAMDTAIYLDGDKLVSGTVDRMNSRLGQIKLREGRTFA